MVSEDMFRKTVHKLCANMQTVIDIMIENGMTTNEDFCKRFDHNLATVEQAAALKENREREFKNEDAVVQFLRELFGEGIDIKNKNDNRGN